MSGRGHRGRNGDGPHADARRLDITTLGKFSLSISGTPLRIVSRKANALLGYLAISETVEETRERLVGLLWSETPEENARASLRQILHEIRGAFQAFGFDGLRTEKRVISLDQSRINVDLQEIVDMALAGLVHPRFGEIPRLPSALLADFEDVDPAFRIWLLAKRQALHDRLTRRLETELRSTPDDRHEEIAQAIMSLDPTHEEACRSLIRARTGRGDFGGALRLYKSLWDLLEEEFDVEPSIETQNLIVEVRSAATTAAVPGGPSDAGAEPSTSVALLERPLPVAAAVRDLVLNIGAFDASATHPDQRYIVSGFRHELVASLVRFREWRVRDEPQGASSASGGEHEYRIDASALTTPNDIRLVLTLREAQTGIYVWSDQYRITLSNWFEAQQAIVRRIAVGLNIHLSASRLSRLSTEAGIAPHVYDRWLRAQEMIYKFTPKDWAQAADIFRSTISDTPNFSPAYSSLVQINNSVHFVHPGVFRAREREREALELARHAVQLDPIDSRAQLAMGWAYAMAGSFANAGIHMGLAVELNENDPWTVMSVALFHAFCARPDKARQFIAQAARPGANPTVMHWVYASTASYLCGDYGECIDASLQSGDGIWTNVAWRAAARAQLGDIEAARADMRRFIDGLRPQWKGAGPANEPDMIRWLLHLYPIQHRAEWERLRAGLAGAGAPVEGTGHGIW
jgi:DNA-binding SARP family transcriptional activator/TolB-like protein